VIRDGAEHQGIYYIEGIWLDELLHVTVESDKMKASNRIKVKTIYLETS